MVLMGPSHALSVDGVHPRPGLRPDPEAATSPIAWERRLGGIVLALLLAFACPAAAQVMEIGENGAVTVYDHPAAAPAPRRARRPDLSKFRAAIAPAAQSARVSEALIEAIAWRESRFQSGAVSRAGALGEMQLMPATARRLGVDPHDTRQNLFGGAAYIRSLLEKYNGDVVKTLAAYNAGPGAVDRYGGMPPYAETKAYVADILEHLSQMALQDTGSGQNR